MDKFCLNWNGYNTSIRESFRKLREDQSFFDVTLVTDDGQHIQAHKIILSTGSNFFNDIFLKSKQSNILIYLKGISSDKLEPVIDFIYNGEVFVTQEQLEQFIDIGTELEFKGLEGELTGVSEQPTNFQEKEPGYDNYSNAGDEKVITKMDKENLQLSTNNELDLQINEMIEKNGGVWRCKICGKTTTRHADIRKHTETHIEGMSHACDICSKIFQNRHGLKTHISNIHSELFLCDTCEKNRNEQTFIQRAQANKALIIIRHCLCKREGS